MEIKRSELMPGVWLSYLHSDKFKTACLSLTMLTQLSRDTAAMNALIPCVLRRGTTRYRDMEALANRFDELYGSAIEPVVRRIGEIQCIGFYASIPEEQFITGGSNILHETAELMGNFTPRISGVINMANDSFSYRLSILKSANGNPAVCQRFFYDYDRPMAGVGHFIHTYSADGNPLPSFEGEPEPVKLNGDIDRIASEIWENLNEENKISLFVRMIDPKVHSFTTRIINKNK